MRAPPCACGSRWHHRAPSAHAPRSGLRVPSPGTSVAASRREGFTCERPARVFESSSTSADPLRLSTGRAVPNRRTIWHSLSPGGATAGIPLPQSLRPHPKVPFGKCHPARTDCTTHPLGRRALPIRNAYGRLELDLAAEPDCRCDLCGNPEQSEHLLRFAQPPASSGWWVATLRYLCPSSDAEAPPAERRKVPLANRCSRLVVTSTRVIPQLTSPRACTLEAGASATEPGPRSRVS
jgi:hypothetical protein